MNKIILVFVLMLTNNTYATCSRVPFEDWNKLLPYPSNTRDLKEILENNKMKRKFLCLSQPAEIGSGEYQKTEENTIVYQRDKWGTIRYDQPSYVIISISANDIQPIASVSSSTIGDCIIVPRPETSRDEKKAPA